LAKIKLQGHASGTGILTVTAPNTSTDRTITLPDDTATIATTTDVAARLPSITDNGNATAITIDSAENIGIGAAPKTTGSTYTGVNIGGSGLLLGYKTQEGGADIAWANNMYFTNNYYRMFNEETSALYQVNGTFIFKVAAAGAADSVITWTDAMVINNDGRVISQSNAKVWAKFSGTGTPSFDDSYNCSSISDSGIGNYYVNYTNNLANSNYAKFVDTYDTNQNSTLIIAHQTSNFSTSSMQVMVQTTTGSAADEPHINVLCFGD
jgi:hypothetical protein